MIDKLAREGNPDAFAFSKAVVKGLDFSFSGLKTSFLYFLRDQVKNDPDFVSAHMKKIFVLQFRLPSLNRLPESLSRPRKKQGYVKLQLQEEFLPIPVYVKQFIELR